MYSVFINKQFFQIYFDLIILRISRDLAWPLYESDKQPSRASIVWKYKEKQLNINYDNYLHYSSFEPEIII
jgi:hypothetical protein